MRDVPFRLALRPRLRFGAATLRAAFIVVVLAGLGWSLLDIVTREINEVHVHGALSEAERNEVGAAASAAIVAGRRSAAHIVEAVESLGWSHGVRVWRHWPDRMHVAVTREPLAARWGDAAYLTTSGEVVELPDDIAGDNMPVLRTHQASGVEAMRLYGLLHGIATDAGLAIVELAENALGEWSVQLDNDVRVMLGASELSGRFARFLTVWNAELASHEQPVVTVDARYPAGVAVAWAQTNPPAAPQSIARVVASASDTDAATPPAAAQAEALTLAGLPATPAELAVARERTALGRGTMATQPAPPQPRATHPGDD